MTADGDADPLFEALQAAFAAVGPQPGARLLDDDDALLADLQAAAHRNELSLVYQRQIGAHDGRLKGVEALLRWRCPRRGLVSPEVFIPLAERSAMIGPITHWVLDKVMVETRDFEGVTVGFNASALEFADPTFVDDLAELMQRRSYDPQRLEIEITETALLTDALEVEANIARLGALGVRTALDDFGAAGAGLATLRRLAFDTVKIDKGLVQAAGLDPAAAALIEALGRFCRAGGARVVGEGVEHPAQRDLLASLGVDVLQGYLFGAPSPLDEIRS